MWAWGPWGSKNWAGPCEVSPWGKVVHQSMLWAWVHMRCTCTPWYYLAHLRVPWLLACLHSEPYIGILKNDSCYQCLGANCGSPPSVLLCGLTKCFSFLGALHFFKSYLISIHHVPSIRLFPPQYWTPLHSNNWDNLDELGYYFPWGLWQ